MMDETRARGYDVDRTTLALARAAQLIEALQGDGIAPHVGMILCVHPTQPLAEEAIDTIGRAVRDAAAAVRTAG